MLFCVKDGTLQSLTFNLGKYDLFGRSSNDIYEYKISMRNRNRKHTLLI